ncbi:hypothetical protein [Schumannella soli]|uniref:DUF4190 domain-containing protein n=1 Tax=Schumannella soli TaxID=2590779 RepID=A0A506Y6I3_9MICO|nr:hypothetical protein [Schumannella soli]TPW77642.1 hypothetical protein FJ657_02990 [Schumannella soli]
MAALILAIGSLVAPAVLFLFFPLLAVAAAAAIVAILLAVSAARRGRRGPIIVWSIVLASVALVVNSVVFGVVFWQATASWRVNGVQVYTDGGESYTAEYQIGEHGGTETWHRDWAAHWLTKQPGGSLTLTAEPGHEGEPLQCRVLIEGREVANESSTSGSVTCRYD